jgi:hypothetical protein
VQEARAFRSVARCRAGRVADKDVYLSRLERREALLRRERRELDGLGVSQHRCRHGLAEVDVESDWRPVFAREPEARHGVVHAAAQGASIHHLLEEVSAAFLAAPSLALAGIRGRFAVVVVIAAERAARSEEQDDGEEDAERPPLETTQCSSPPV